MRFLIEIANVSSVYKDQVVIDKSVWGYILRIQASYIMFHVLVPFAFAALSSPAVFEDCSVVASVGKEGEDADFES